MTLTHLLWNAHNGPQLAHFMCQQICLDCLGRGASANLFGLFVSGGRICLDCLGRGAGGSQTLRPCQSLAGLRLNSSRTSLERNQHRNL